MFQGSPEPESASSSYASLVISNPPRQCNCAFDQLAVSSSSKELPFTWCYSCPSQHHPSPKRGTKTDVGQCYWEQPRQRNILWRAREGIGLPSFLPWLPTLSSPAFPRSSRGLLLPRRPNVFCIQRRQNPPQDTVECQEVFKHVNPFMKVSITSVTWVSI